MSSTPDPAAPTVPAMASDPVPDTPRASAPPAVPDAAEPSPALSDDPAELLGAGALRPVSTSLIPARYVAGIVGDVIWALMIAGAITAAALTGMWWLAALGLLPLLILLQHLLLTPRRVRAIGYLDAEEDLTIASGIMFRSIQTIPYGRVQSVKIDEGPVDRRYGLAKLTVSTANGASTVVLPGLPKAEAERLRALLTARGIETMAAL
ncbi:PH domain-containing protein [Brachybacterium vulturis]|uniref:PH domain-containing protein n=1 Tax=Brachybacterium vulturis TaxID=2017484 RepID=UPI003735C8CE